MKNTFTNFADVNRAMKMVFNYFYKENSILCKIVLKNMLHVQEVVNFHIINNNKKFKELDKRLKVLGAQNGKR